MLFRNRKFLLGLIIIAVLVAATIANNALTDPTLRRTGSFLPKQPPGPGAPLGTDSL